MSLKDLFTKNMYVTTPGDPDPFFRPRSYNRPKAEVVEAVQRTLAGLSRWRVEEYRETQGRFHAIKFTLFPPATDDVNIYVVQGLDGVTRLEATSQSRGGRGDFGRNKRNLRQLLSKLDEILKPVS